MNNKKEKVKNLNTKKEIIFLKYYVFFFRFFSLEFHTSLSNNTQRLLENIWIQHAVQQVKFAASIIRELSVNYISIDLCVTITFVII